MELYSRTRGGRRVWYVRAHYFDGTARRSRRVSTGVVDDGTRASKDAAAAIGHGIERDLAARGSSAPRSNATLKQALATLIRKQQLAGKSAATLEIITEKAGRLFDHFGPEKPLHEIGAKHCDEYAVKARAVRSVASVHRELLVLGQAFGAVGLDKPAMPELGDATAPRDRALEVVEQRQLLSATPPRRRIHVLALLQLGVRKEDLWKITEVDWEGRYVFVAGTKTKLRSKRWVPVPEELFAELVARRAELELFERWTNMDRDLRLYARRAGLGPISCNDLRRTYATHMARSGCHQLLLAKFMGTSVKMLDEVYARLEKRADHHHEAVARGVPRLRKREG